MSEIHNAPTATAASSGKQPSLSRTPLAGNLPYLAAAILCAGAFYAGRMDTPQRNRVALVEKGAIVTEALLANPERSQGEIDAQIKAPILTILRKYADAGYAVIDTSKDEAGRMAVVALPADAVDITAEMRAAITAAGPQRTGPAPTAPTSSSTTR